MYDLVSKDLFVYRKDDNGEIQLLESNLKGNQLVVTTSQNSVIGVFMFLGRIALGVLAGASVMYEGLDYDAMFDGQYSDYSSYSIPIPKYHNYIIFIKKSYADTFDSQMKSIKEANDRLMEKYGLIWNTRYNAYTTPYLNDINLDSNRGFDMTQLEENNALIRKLQDDPDYKKIKDKLGMDSLPPPVQVLAKAVMSSHDYLYDERKLDKLDHTLYVILLDPWIHSPEAAAMETARPTEDSFLQINPVTVKTIVNGGPDSKLKMDDLYVTMAHEMLHCIQWNYYDGRDTRYSEALAVMFEAEAAEYFAKKNIIDLANFSQTTRLFQLNNQPWLESTKDDGQRGYAFSHVLEYERDSRILLPGGSNDQFLLDLMDSREQYDSVEAIYQLLDPNEQELMYRYLTSANGITTATGLDNDKTRHRYTSSDSLFSYDIQKEPLTAKLVQFMVPNSLDSSSNSNSVLMHYKSGESQAALNQMNQHLLYSLTFLGDQAFNPKKSWLEVDQQEGFYSIPVSDLPGNTNTKINNLFITDDTRSLDIPATATLQSMVVIKPDKPLKINFDTETLTFTVDLPPVPPNTNPLNQGRIVEITPQIKGVMPYQAYVPTGENSVSVHLLEVLLNDDKNTVLDLSKISRKVVQESLTLMMKTSLNTMALASNGMLKTSSTSDGDIYLGIDSSFTLKDDQNNQVNLVEKLREKGIPHGLIYDIETSDNYVSVTVRTDYGAYLKYGATLNNMFKYFLFTTFSNNAGIDMEKVNKRLEEMNQNNIVKASIRNVYSSSTNPDISTGINVEDTYYKTSETVFGPNSTSIDMAMPFVSSINNTIPKSSYTGKSMFRVTSNIDKVVKEYREDTKTQRLEDARTKAIEAYLTNNEDYLNRIREDKGFSAMEKEINDESIKIDERISENESEFDEEFYKAFDEMVKILNSAVYHLTLYDGSFTLSVFEQNLGGTYEATDKDGIYKMKFIEDGQVMYETDLILLPTGQIIVKGEFAIFN